MTKIVEIIPDKLPKWAIDAMEEGQLFNVMLERIVTYEQVFLQAHEHFLLSEKPFYAGMELLREAHNKTGE